MKKILILCLFVVLSIFLDAQTNIGIYYISDTDLIKGSKTDNIVGAYFTLGISSAKANNVVEGKESELVLKNKKPSFRFVFGEDNLTKYIFSNIANIDNVVLVKLHKKGNSRHLRTGKYGTVSGVEKGLSDKDVFPINIEELNDSTLVITPKGHLKKGEYCFYYTGDIPKTINKYKSVFDFSIK